MHANIRSINKILDQLTALLTLINFDTDILILSECWLKDLSMIPQLDGYKSYYTYNNKLQNDGVVLCAKHELEVTVWEPSFDDGNCLVCTIGKELALIGIYRSPSYPNIGNFITSLTDVIAGLESFRNIALLGDINIDIKPTNKDRCSDYYLTSTAALGLLPTHTYPTRANNCLDHILLKTNLVSRALVIDSPVTDHLPTMLCIKNTLSQTATNPLRTALKVDYTAIKTALDESDFSSVMSATDADQAAERLVSIITETVKAHTTTKVVPRKKTILKPWITSGLLRCMRNRDKLHKKLRKEPENQIIKITYVRYRNFLNNLLRKLKRQFQKGEFDKAKNNPKAMWNVVKNVTNTNKPVEPPRALLNTNEDPRTALNSIYKYFVSVARNLAARITQPTTVPLSTRCAQMNSLVLLEVDFSEVERVIRGLRNDCAPGWDGISPSVIKASSNILVPPITHVCNLSITTGVFPKLMKRGLISPIYKQGDRGDVANYRPISVLPVLSKVLERILNSALVNFLAKNNIIAIMAFPQRMQSQA